MLAGAAYWDLGPADSIARWQLVVPAMAMHRQRRHELGDPGTTEKIVYLFIHNVKVCLVWESAGIERVRPTPKPYTYVWVVLESECSGSLKRNILSHMLNLVVPPIRWNHMVPSS